MLWRRYRWIVIASVPVAALIGALLALALYLGGNPDYREQGGWSAFVYSTVLGAAVGALSSVPAIVGAGVALALKDRALTRTPQARVWIGGSGAAIGALFAWAILAAVNALMSAEGGGAWFALYLIAGMVAAAISAAAAAALIWRTETRAAFAETTEART